MAVTETSLALRPGARRFQLRPAAAFAGVAAVLASFFVAAGAPTPLLPIYESTWHFAPWVLTLAFGVYALALLVALLVVGSLSDHVGRRPLLIGSIALELVAMLIFLVAGNVDTLILARIVQGIATGAATGAFTAAVVELAPEHRKRVGAIIGSISAAAGLSIGALVGGIIAEFSSSAATLTWSIFTVVMIVGLLIAIATPESTDKTPGARASLVPRISVPQRARRQFGIGVPSLVGAWMMGALFMGLAPTILGTVFDVHSPLLNGVIAFLEPGSAALTGLIVGRLAPHRTLVLGGIAVIVGAILVITSIGFAIFPLLWIGGVIGGIGFGASLSGSFRDLTPLSQPHERAGLFAAIYLVAYLAFGVPAIIAGLLLSTFGLVTISIAFGAVIVIASGIGLGGQIQLIRRR